ARLGASAFILPSRLIYGLIGSSWLTGLLAKHQHTPRPGRAVAIRAWLTANAFKKHHHFARKTDAREAPKTLLGATRFPETIAETARRACQKESAATPGPWGCRRQEGRRR